MKRQRISKNRDLIRRIHEIIQTPVYFLMLTSTDNESAIPTTHCSNHSLLTELKARIMIGQRFLSLGDNLSQAREQIDNMAMYDGLTGL